MILAEEDDDALAFSVEEAVAAASVYNAVADSAVSEETKVPLGPTTRRQENSDHADDTFTAAAGDVTAVTDRVDRSGGSVEGVATTFTLSLEIAPLHAASHDENAMETDMLSVAAVRPNASTHVNAMGAKQPLGPAICAAEIVTMFTANDVVPLEGMTRVMVELLSLAVKNTEALLAAAAIMAVTAWRVTEARRLTIAEGGHSKVLTFAVRLQVAASRVDTVNDNGAVSVVTLPLTAGIVIGADAIVAATHDTENDAGYDTVAEAALVAPTAFINVTGSVGNPSTDVDTEGVVHVTTPGVMVLTTVFRHGTPPMKTATTGDSAEPTSSAVITSVTPAPATDAGYTAYTTGASTAEMHCEHVMGTVVHMAVNETATTRDAFCACRTTAATSIEVLVTMHVSASGEMHTRELHGTPATATADRRGAALAEHSAVPAIVMFTDMLLLAGGSNTRSGVDGVSRSEGGVNKVSDPFSVKFPATCTAAVTTGPSNRGAAHVSSVSDRYVTDVQAAPLRVTRVAFSTAADGAAIPLVVQSEKDGRERGSCSSMRLPAASGAAPPSALTLGGGVMVTFMPTLCHPVHTPDKLYDTKMPKIVLTLEATAGNSASVHDTAEVVTVLTLEHGTEAAPLMKAILKFTCAPMESFTTVRLSRHVMDGSRHVLAAVATPHGRQAEEACDGAYVPTLQGVHVADDGPEMVFNGHRLGELEPGGQEKPKPQGRTIGDPPAPGMQ